MSQELANTLTHGIGLLLSMAGAVGIVLRAARFGDVWQVVSSSVYGITLVGLYADGREEPSPRSGG